MIEYYSQIRLVHIAAVAASGSLFFLRGLGVLSGARWPMSAPWRYLTYTIDTLLLVAAVLLTIILHQYPLANDWLTTKLVLLVVYIVLGTFALKRGRTPAIRAFCWVAAVIVFLFIVSVARTHDPYGVVRMLVSQRGLIVELDRSKGGIGPCNLNSLALPPAL